PVLSITYPVNGSTYYTLNLTLNWTFTEDYPDKCWYNLNNNATNTSVAGCNDLYANFTAIESAWNNITMWINDTSNNIDEKNVTFYARTNTAPNVTNVTITPTYNGGTYVSVLNDMHCNYTYEDAQGDNDTSAIKWFENNVLTSFTGATVSYQNTTLFQVWKCEVTPSDGIVNATPINSSSVEIRNEPTNLVVSGNATRYTGVAPNHQHWIWAYYTDEDGTGITGATCTIAGTPNGALTGQGNGNYTYGSILQASNPTVYVHTFSCSADNYAGQSGYESTVTFIDHPTNLTGYQNATDVEVNQYVNFTVNYTDANTSSLLSSADCDLNISGIGIYNMTETASDTYEAIVQFTTPGEFTPEVTCSKEYYQDANLTMDIVNSTDNVNPSVNISVNDTDLIHGVESVKIDFNASDQFLDSVIANVTYPNGTLLQQLANQSVDFTFEPDNLTAIGRYNITVFANDTSNNINISESFFYVNDTIDPTINIFVNDTDVEYGIESVTIDFNASDSFLDSVIANVTYPNGTLLQQLANQATDFVFEPANLTALGRYNITVFANDTTGNTNTSTSYFYVNDTIAPTINISVNDTDVEYGVESVLIDFNASNGLLDSVIANVTYPNGTLLQQL
ncbi:MAG: hypothetical protein KAS15_01445, partial [Nanoarchaeota archaeon]|nr:hypothetical protein [Nanoarchaeota archaeon]